ncbi:DNA topoisomerase, type IA, partial [Kipferlia bialata]
RPGHNKYQQIYTFQAPFQGQMSEHSSTSVLGHLTGSDFPEHYKNWNQSDPRDLLTASVNIGFDKTSKELSRTLCDQAAQSDVLVLWLDCDREGEHIAFEVLYVLSNVRKLDEMRNGARTALAIPPLFSHYSNGGNGAGVLSLPQASIRRRALMPPLLVHRAVFSELTQTAIMTALNRRLSNVDTNAFNAVETRRETDLRAGASLTRLQSLRLRRLMLQHGGNERGNCLSYGPVQIPTLGFVVRAERQRQRKMERARLCPGVSLTLACKGVVLNHQRSPLYSLPHASLVIRRLAQSLIESLVLRRLAQSLIESNGTVQAASAAVTPWSQNAPFPLNTIALQKAMAKQGMSASDTMQHANTLYRKGVISYPRSETDKYPDTPEENERLKGIVESLKENRADPMLANKSNAILQHGLRAPRQGRQSDGAHPPVHPTGMAMQAGASDQEKRVYTYVCLHFLATLSPPATGVTHRLQVSLYPSPPITTDREAEKEVFINSVKYTVSPGWMAILLNKAAEHPPDADTEGGTKLQVLSLEAKPVQSSCPKLTEAQLIDLMAQHGIGTDATIAQHIEHLVKRGYMHRQGGLLPTPLGTALLEFYESLSGDGIAPTYPERRAYAELEMRRVVSGERQRRQAVRTIGNMDEDLYSSVDVKIRGMGN